MNIRELKDNDGKVFSPKVSTESVYLKNSTTNLESKLGSIDSNKADKSSLASVATSGSYTDLSNRPSLATVATSGSYTDLRNLPRIRNDVYEGDLNNLVTSGFYRVNISDNSPGRYGQVIVCQGAADTITQIYSQYDTGVLYTRSGNPPEVGGSGSWTRWCRIIMSDIANPSITADGFYVSSLRSLKENIEPTKVNATDLINSQEIVDFNYKADEDKVHKVGLIADDSDPLFLDKKGETVDLYNTCGILMKAVQELSVRVKELESKIN